MLATAVLVAATALLVPLALPLPGYLLLAVGAAVAWQAGPPIRHALIPLYAAIGILGLTPISTDISLSHIALMGGLLLVSLALPYVWARRHLRPNPIRFSWKIDQLMKRDYAYAAFAIGMAYLLLPFYLRTTGVYLNWPAARTPEEIFLLFLGTNALGFWDELFFICTVLALLRTVLPFRWANLAQAVLFSSFLFALGFRSWGIFFIFLFALFQGIVFRRTQSLSYVLFIHLGIDFILFLTLLHLHGSVRIPFLIT